MKHFAKILLGAFLFLAFSFVHTSFAKDKTTTKVEVSKSPIVFAAILDGQVIDITPSNGQSITVPEIKDVLPDHKPNPEAKANAPPLTKRR